jgi:hypothetical protein
MNLSPLKTAASDLVRLEEVGAMFAPRSSFEPLRWYFLCGLAYLSLVTSISFILMWV